MNKRKLSKPENLLFAAPLLLLLVPMVVYSQKQIPTLPIHRAFSAMEIRKVVLRASQAHSAKVGMTTNNKIKISALPTGGAEGYHSSDPNWRATPAQEQGLDFVTKKYGDTLVISTKKEIMYIHHHYELYRINIQVPKGIEVVKEELQPNGEGKPNLSQPK